MDTQDEQSAVPAAAAPPRDNAARALLRWCLGLFAALLIIGGGLFLRSGLRLRAECLAARSAKVLDIQLDVGRSGRHVATLKQVADFPCHQYICMEIPLRAGEGAGSLFRGLRLSVAVNDAAGVERMAGVYPPDFQVSDDVGSFTLAEGSPMPLGEYSVVVDVAAPAPALAGRPVRFVSGYVFCGIEWLLPTMHIGTGAAAVAIAAIIGVTLWATRRKAIIQPGAASR